MSHILPMPPRVVPVDDRLRWDFIVARAENAISDAVDDLAFEATAVMTVGAALELRQRVTALIMQLQVVEALCLERADHLCSVKD